MTLLPSGLPGSTSGFPTLLALSPSPQSSIGIVSSYQTHISNFDRPDQCCQRININLHRCSQETRSGWFIYRSTDGFEHIYSILSDPTGTVNISTVIFTSVLRRLVLMSLSTYQRWVSNTHIRFWLAWPVLSTYLQWFPQVSSGDWVWSVYLHINGEFRTHISDFDLPDQCCQHIYRDFHKCLQETGSDQSINISTGSFERTYPILTDLTSAVNGSTSIFTGALRRLGPDGLSTNQRTLLKTNLKFWPIKFTNVPLFPDFWWLTVFQQINEWF